ncbi:hypothetical protein CK203_090683 [Vitis vinifera]|uniref:Uncharacterized protein n=1 Tax=Vitis vinifera TaxID=29760 RepID=A0A438BW51_VITVI|nr:hypothetical protein CK203_090683 [Vitis vinifera]
MQYASFHRHWRSSALRYFLDLSPFLPIAPHIQTQRLNVEACLIISDWKADDERPVEPIFWPPNPEEVKSLITNIKDMQEKELKSWKAQSTEPRLVCGSAEGIIDKCDDKLEAINYRMEHVLLDNLMNR